MTLAQWFSLKGRISRKTWWIFYFLIPNAIIFAANILDARVLPKNSMPFALGKGGGELSFVSAFALLLGLWLSLAGQVKRWHDQDRTGWWGCLTPIPIFLVVWFLFFIDATKQIFLVYLTAQIAFPLAFVLFLNVTGADPNANQFILQGMALVATSLLFLWVLFFANGGFLRGTPGPNRFGPDPLAPELPPGGYGGGHQPPYPPQAPGGWQPQGPPPPPSGGWGAPPPPPQGGGSVPPIRRG